MSRANTRIAFRSVVLLLLVYFLHSGIYALGQTGPIGVEELKSLVRGPLAIDEVVKTVEHRGVTFVATEGIITSLKDEVIKHSPQFIASFSTLAQTVRRKRPDQLLVGIAAFAGGKAQFDSEQLSLGISHYLDSPDTPTHLIEFKRLDERIATDDAAFQAGNNNGLDLVLWGEWRLLSDGKEVISTHVRVISTYVSIDSTKASRDLVLDSFAHSRRLELIEAATAKTAQLIVVLASLAFYNQSNYQRAEVLLQRLPTQNSEVLFYRGNCRWRQGKREEAVELFNQAAAADTQFLEARNNLGALQLELQKLDDAIKNFELALKINPDSDRVLDNLGVALIRKSESDSGIDPDMYKDGLDRIEKAKSINPQNSTALYNYAEALTFGFPQPRLPALLAFNEYLMQNPADHPIWVRCANYWARHTGDAEQAHVFASLAVEHDPYAREYLEDFVAILSQPPFREDTLRISQKLRELLKSQNASRAGTREGIFAIIVRAQVELGQPPDALRSFREAGIREDGLKGCAAHLSYRLASGDITVGHQIQPELLKQYYAAVYESFFGEYLFGNDRDHGGVVFINDPEDHKRMLDIFDKILQSQPSSMGALVGKGILHLRVLNVPSKSRYWRLGGFLDAQKDPSEWARQFRVNGKSALQRAANQTSDVATRQYLTQCFEKLGHVSLDEDN